MAKKRDKNYSKRDLTVIDGDCATVVAGENSSVSGGRGSTVLGGWGSKVRGGLYSALILSWWDKDVARVKGSANCATYGHTG